MRSTCRLSLTLAGFAIAAFCFAQDPNAAPQPTPAPSNPVAAEPTVVPQQAPVEAPPALPVVPAPLDAGQAPAADTSVASPPPATAPLVVNPSPDANTAPAAPAREAKARRKVDLKPGPAEEKEEQKSAESSAAAATSVDTPANTPPSDGTAASPAAPAPTTATEVLPPAAGVPDPMANLNTEAAQPEKRHTVWVPVGALVLGAAWAIALVVRRRRGDDEISILAGDVSIVERDTRLVNRDRGLSRPASPMPRHS